MRKLKIWERIILYACVGVSAEVIFTSLFDYAFIISDPRLIGQSYLWMFPIWGFGLLGLEKVSTSEPWQKLTWWQRGIAHGLLIFLVEAFTGAVIREITGKVPWDYSEAFFGIDGLIRLDYFPIWATLGLAFEKMFPFILRINVANKNHEFELKGDNDDCD